MRFSPHPPPLPPPQSAAFHLTELIKAEGKSRTRTRLVHVCGDLLLHFNAVSEQHTSLALHVPPRSECIFSFFYLKVPTSFEVLRCVFFLLATTSDRFTREVNNPSLLLRTRPIAKLSAHTHTPFSVLAIFLFR